MAAHAQSLNRAELEELRALQHNPRQYMARLFVLNNRKRLQRLDDLLVPADSPARQWPEQEKWLLALLSHRFVLGLKPRQVGYTTITNAYFHWKTQTSRYARTLLQMVHEDATQRRCADMLKLFWAKTPRLLRKPIGRHNQDETLFGTDEEPLGAVYRIVAGGRGQGRGATATDIAATEMSKWPQGSSASTRALGQTADEEVFSSAQSTIHEGSDGQVVVESTGNGPRGLFYELVQVARHDPEWAFVFVPWSAVPRYRRELTPQQARDLEQELDRDEQRLIKDFRLTLEQVAWRRWKIRTQKYTRLSFRLEFPLTEDEPFLHDESGWFNQDAVTALQKLAEAGRALNPDWPDEKETLRIFRRPEKGRTYFMGVDTSGGTGGDEAVIVILRDDGYLVALWATSRASPEEQAVMVSQLGGLYGSPLAVIEANKYGESVIKAVQKLGGVTLWTNERGRWFYSTGETSGAHKRLACVHAREVVDAELVVVNDLELCRQLQRMVEKPNGKVEGSGTTHDDRAMALILCLYGMRRYAPPAQGTIEGEKDRVRRILEMQHRFGGPT